MARRKSSYQKCERLLGHSLSPLNDRMRHDVLNQQGNH